MIISNTENLTLVSSMIQYGENTATTLTTLNDNFKWTSSAPGILNDEAYFQSRGYIAPNTKISKTSGGIYNAFGFSPYFSKWTNNHNEPQVNLYLNYGTNSNGWETAYITSEMVHVIANNFGGGWSNTNAVNVSYIGDNLNGKTVVTIDEGKTAGLYLGNGSPKKVYFHYIVTTDGWIDYNPYSHNSGAKQIVITLPKCDKLTFKDGNGTIISSLTQYRVDGTSYTSTQTTTSYRTNVIPDLPTGNYDGWQNSGDNTIYTAGSQFTSAVTGKEIIFTPHSSSVTITLNNTGGSGGLSSINIAQGTSKGSYPSINIPTKTGYKFNGYWSAESGGTQWYDKDGNSLRDFTLTENTTWYAHWTADTYTVTYDANGGSGSMNDSMATYNAAFRTRQNTFTRAGYTFNGWREDSATTGTVWSLTDSGTYESGKDWTWTRTKNITLYAQWTPNIIKVELNKNGGIGGTSEYYYKFNTHDGNIYYYTDSQCTNGITSIEIPINETGAAFQGYYLSTTQYINASGNFINNLYSKESTSPVILLASWKTLYKVTFNLNGGSLNSYTGSYTQSCEAGSNINLSNFTPSKQNAQFIKWTQDGTDKTGVITVNSDLTFNAVYSDNCLVSFNKNPSTAQVSNMPASAYVAKGTEYSLPTTIPARTNFNFVGWSTDQEGKNTVSSPMTINEDTTFYANWNRIQFTVTWDEELSCAETGQKTVNSGDTLTLPSSCTKNSQTINRFSIYSGNSASNFIETIAGGGETSAIYNNIYITAAKEDECIIKFYCDGGTLSDNRCSISDASEKIYIMYSNKNTNVTLPTALSKTFYSFSGWHKKGTTNKITSLNTGNNTLIELEADWASNNSSSITINYNGGKDNFGNGNESKSISLTEASKYRYYGSLLNFENEIINPGYILIGWQDENKTTISNNTPISTSAINITAVWKQRQENIYIKESEAWKMGYLFSVKDGSLFEF